jgi:cytochrome c-type biogenesis protein CcmH/NrfG
MCVRESISSFEEVVEGPPLSEALKGSFWSKTDQSAGLALRLAVPLCLVGLIFAVFIPALEAGLVGWDDDDLLLNNTLYRTLTPDTIRWMFTTSFAGHFQPLTWLSYSLDWMIWQREAFGYHLTNVVLHALTALAFYGVVGRLLAVVAGADVQRRSRPIVLSAGFAAALFALHPLRVESVAWLAERRDVLSGFLYVLSVGLYLRYVGASSRLWGGGRGAYAAALLMCALSLMAKATAVTLPVVLLILDVYPLRRLVLGGRVWLEKVPFIVLAVAAGVRAVMAQDLGGALYGLEQHGLGARLAQACYGLMFYLWKTIWPTDLGPLYEIPAREVLFGSMLWVSALVLLSVCCVVFVLRRRRPSIATAFAVYVVLILPVLGLVQSGPQLVADRYSYLACMAFAAIGGGALLGVLCHARRVQTTNGRSILALLVAIVVGVLGRSTFAQAEIWKSASSLWERGVAMSPHSAIAHTNYADALVRRLQYQEAFEHYVRALELNPADAVALHHLANLHVRLGRADRAAPLYIKALGIDPTRHRACLSLARLFMERGYDHQALAILRDGVRRRGDAANLVHYLADILATHPDQAMRDGDEAVELALHLLRLNGRNHVLSLLTLASAQAEARRFEEAVETARHAREIATGQGADRLVEELERRIESFKNRTPFHVMP